jgi:hypothetical protein
MSGAIGNELVLAISAGVALALPYLLYVQRSRERRRMFGLGLIAAAAVYVVLAASRGTLRDVLIEAGGILLFGIVAFLGIRHRASFLAFGWVAHVAWDLLLHPVNGSSYAPWWYPVLCVGFDLVVAGAIVGASWHPPGQARPGR